MADVHSSLRLLAGCTLADPATATPIRSRTFSVISQATLTQLFLAPRTAPNPNFLRAADMAHLACCCHTGDFFIPLSETVPKWSDVGVRSMCGCGVRKPGSEDAGLRGVRKLGPLACLILTIIAVCRGAPAISVQTPSRAQRVPGSSMCGPPAPSSPVDAVRCLIASTGRGACSRVQQRGAALGSN